MRAESKLTLVRVAKKALGDSGVKVASVSTAFPSGQAPRNVKITDTKFAVSEGADEIEVGIPYSEPVMDGPVIHRA